MAAQQPISQDPEEKQADLLATLAAARELGPDMDKALAESYLQRQRAEAAPKQSVVAQPPQAPQRPNEALRPIFMCAGLIAFVALLIVSHGWLWFTFFPLMWWTGWWWRGGSRAEWHDQRRAQREQWRQARREMRYGAPGGYHYSYRYDYRYGNDDRMSPPEAPAQLDTPPTQPATPPATPAPPLPPVVSAPPASSPSPAGQQPPVNPAG
ncbi:MAG TPA: hypothetical protein VGS80_24410 [Ktedonobacterales bacterium]|nr:hypothetical protein [Ktedonobacterales bacterium]